MMNVLSRYASALLLVFVSLHACAQSKSTYQYFRLGTAADVSTPVQGGFALMGGGTDLDEAFQWMCARSGGGDFLVLRASGDDDYNPYVQGLCHMNSVATLILPSREAANDPAVVKIMEQAEAIFIAGGDQANYINFWKGTPVQASLNQALVRGVPIGGTSAGLAVMGEYMYTAQNDPTDGPDLTSKIALADPFAKQVVLVKGFLANPLLQDTITDTHFVSRDRMGRSLAFMARILSTGEVGGVKAVCVDERTAVLLSPGGEASVTGKGAAYFLRADATPVLHPGVALTFGPVAVEKVRPGGVFHISAWTGTGTHYSLHVVAGAVHSSQKGGSAY